MTGTISMSKDIETTTYDKNLYDYYETDLNSLSKTFDVTVKDTYTIKSHLFETDGKWIYNDLAQSPFIWTFINDEKYEILLDSVAVEEQENNDIYEATVKFHFSQPTTLL